MKTPEKVILCAVIVTVGTLMHFVHELPFFTVGMGYIFPVNECVWEHMKMIFYPLLGLSIYLTFKKGDIEPFGGPMLACLIAIPVQIALFYAYWPITHHSVLIIDVIEYFIVMVSATLLGIRWSRKKSVKKNKLIYPVIAGVVLIVLAILTYNPLDMIFFQIEQ